MTSVRTSGDPPSRRRGEVNPGEAKNLDPSEAMPGGRRVVSLDPT